MLTTFSGGMASKTSRPPICKMQSLALWAINPCEIVHNICPEVKSATELLRIFNSPASLKLQAFACEAQSITVVFSEGFLAGNSTWKRNEMTRMKKPEKYFIRHSPYPPNPPL
jgi:hypothetical protein